MNESDAFLTVSLAWLRYNFMAMLWRRWFTAVKILVVGLVFVLLLAPEWPVFGSERHRLNTLVGLRKFDFVDWELRALTAKVQGSLASGQDYLDEDVRRSYVLAYLELLSQVLDLQRQVDALYADPEVADPDTASIRLQQEINSLRAELRARQPLAEAIVQEQVATVLVEEGFDFLNVTWPPVLMHMTPLPQILIVSPRDEIRQIYNVPLVSDITTPAKDHLESDVFTELELSALVVPIGGLGIYPAMIVETTNINFLADVVAHEWAHHWLTLRPVGLGYAASPDMRTINETIASVVGTEVGERVVERFYPEFVPAVEPALPPIVEPVEEPAFDFRLEMAATREKVDELLAQGKVDEAERYMEARRKFFVENGYNIRKLNQAYFAFYGAYADTPGATGEDPVGPTVLAVRERSGSLREFLANVAGVTSFGELQAVLEELSEPEP